MNIFDKMNTGCLPSPKDDRDFKYAASMPIGALPASVDLRPNLPAIRNQGQSLACVAFAASSARTREDYEAKRIQNVYSPEYLFYNLRVMEGTFPANSPTYPRDVLKILNNKGIPLEVSAPWGADWNIVPNDAANTEAGLYKISSYHSVTPTVDGLKQAIADGNCVLVGLLCYNSFFYPQGGYIAPPASGEKSNAGHCVLLVGYDDKGFLVLNSWGTTWGNQGYGRLSYGYVTSQNVFEAWVIDALNTIVPVPPVVSRMTITADMLCYKTGSCKLEASAVGGQNLGYVEAGDTVSYIFDLSIVSNKMSFQVAAQEAPTMFDVYLFTKKIGTVNVPKTDGWQTFVNVDISANLPIGKNCITLVATGKHWNLLKILV